MPMLELNDVNSYYGNIQALKGITLSVDQGEIVCLIGSNGAGKSTTLKTISGLVHPRTGTVTLEGKVISGMPAHEVAGLGVAQSPEGRRIFPRMTVLENLEMGKYHRKNARAELHEDLERVYHLFPRVKERAQQPAGTLSGGEQQMVAIGRALMARPQLLLLDEPSMGLAPMIVQQIFEIVTQINSEGMTIVLVEQNAQKALSVADRAYVMETGTVVLSGDAKALLHDDKVKAAYLGAGAGH